MGEGSKIEWCDHTFNPWEGCQKVGPGCDHCYAETRNARFGGGTAPNWGPGAPRRLTSDSNWRQPLKWDLEAARLSQRARVFCASLADWADKAAPPGARTRLGALIQTTPNLEWLLLTKRVGNAVDMLIEMFPEGVPDNVRVGATIVNHEEAVRDLWKVAQVRDVCQLKPFLSMEPLLGMVDLAAADPNWARYIGQVIAGGESGSGARPMHPDWARSLRDQCAAANVPFLFKQWGEWAPKSGIDVYCHGSERREREYPNSPGIAWLADGRICMRDFTVSEHQQRIRTGEAHNFRAIEQDWDALRAFHATLDDPAAESVGFQWMYRVGKKAAGRQLNGVEHNGFP